MNSRHNFLFYFSFVLILFLNVYLRLFPIFLPSFSESRSKLKGFYQNDHGRTYLLDIDGYGWAGHVRSILPDGHSGTTFRAGESGSPMDNAAFYHINAWLYRLLNIIFKLDFDDFIFYIPAVYFLLFIVTLFCFVRKFFSPPIALFAMLYVGLSPIILQRSCIGWFDLDMIVLTFFLILLYIFIAVLESPHAKSAFLFFIWCLLISFSVILWSGWPYFIFCILLLSIGVLLFRHKLPDIYICRAWWFIALVPLFFIYKNLPFDGVFKMDSFIGAIRYNLNLFSLSHIEGWPNGLMTAGEFTNATIKMLISLAPGLFLFTYLLIAVIFSFFFIFFNNKNRFVVFCILISSLISLSMSFLAMRFFFFAACFLGILAANMTGCILLYLHERIKSVYSFLRKAGLYFAVIVIVLCPVFAFSSHARGQMSSVAPLMNDEWSEFLRFISDSTPPNSVINTWWDYGDWYKYISKRNPLIDGHNQYRPHTYWMARVFISCDQLEAANILRFINNDGCNYLYPLVYEVGSSSRAANLLNSLFLSDTKHGKDIIDAANISKTLGTAILNAVYDSPKNKKIYFVVNSEMLAYFSVIEHMAMFDFDTLSFPHRKPTFISYRKHGVLRNSRIDFGSMHISFGKSVEGRSLFFWDGSSLSNRGLSYFDDTKDDLLVIQNNETYSLVAAKDKTLFNNIFSRLYFMRGFGLNNFKYIGKSCADNAYLYEVIL